MKWLNDGERMRKLIAELRAGRSAVRSPTGTGLNALVLGGGGREYAIAWRLARSDSIATIDAIPGNPAMSLFARTLDIPIDQGGRLEQHLAASFIDLVIVGPDELVASGVATTLRRAGVSVVCPSREAAKLEWSKSFAKEVLRDAGVPTAASRALPDARAARAASRGAWYALSGGSVRRAHADRRRLEGHRVQRPIRRSPGAGDPAAARGRLRPAHARPRRRPARGVRAEGPGPLQPACVRRHRALRRGLSRPAALG